MATIKVFLPTYRRNHLLPRSIDSLLNQTFKDWVCEVHNDDPKDNFPEKYISSLNDSRFTIINHTVNLGAVATFNLMFEPAPDKYLCLLEDDNWWENTFLEDMIAAMEQHTFCSVAFAGINVWQEKEGHIWNKVSDTSRKMTTEKETSKLISFPQFKHIFNYHHSNCSTIIRNDLNLRNYKVPANIRVDFIEAIHERAFPHPLLFINKPLANFALTIDTARQNNLDGMYEHALLLIDSFFKCIEPDNEYAQKLWDDARQNKLRSYFRLLYTGLTCKSSRKLLKYATMYEWLTFVLYNIKYPLLLYRCANAKNTYGKLWENLLKNTRDRVNESKIL
ncbi:glycosyltransferase family 2 protein [Mucilaginibacter sp.]|uniref:glycosyltransferase family 2 protein n=1 Tax=Mucilaginibacter sp. TaxID=1882438 RepID=UPI00262A1611|nr:glycosyltransferase family 2 protein [Mucilaginibacter sp.]MDB4927012.1 glycosyltransferase family 2 protein [Mucilaginibacter sp.]